MEGSVKRLGVLGGTFDPIHIGHLVAASEALASFDLDQVLFVPAGEPWQKSLYSGGEDRFMMTTLAAAAHPRFAVSRIELDRKGPTYTADTMAQLRSFYEGDVELFFIMGADALQNLGSWHKLAELASLAELIVLSRPGFDAEPEREESWPAVSVVPMPAIEISSTDIRERVSTGRPIDFLAPAAVVDLIRRQGLYSTLPVGDDGVERA
jgi:nicotinate-nucleotide adenylyltransferase